VRYAVAQGFTVFLVSWANVGPDEADASWDEYLDTGVLQALRIAGEVTGEQPNVLGFCVGGTLVGSALAVLAAQQKKSAPVPASVTLLTTFLDFTDVGEIGAYISEPFVKAREAELKDGGIVPGAELAQAFASLRANDLIWNYVQNNYLKGKTPPPFDLLYWNGDSTNLPGPWYAYYLRNMYFENKLCKPAALQMLGAPIDVGLIDIPAFVFAAKEDHIVPWRSAYASAQCLSGDVEFVLGASGHIAGVINPASKNKRSYWSSNESVFDQSSSDWLDAADETAGSWWPKWAAWLATHSGVSSKVSSSASKPKKSKANASMVPARKQLGNARYKPIVAAPGEYVKKQC
jgi:polyhydroxyalkanoate synthase subunit PhaC